MKPKICIVIAKYYNELSNDLLKGAISMLNKNGVKSKNVHKIFVPGVFELPVVLARNIDSYDGFIALGCVIKGKTPHFKFISKSATDSIMQLSINYKKPIGNGIITCLNKKQAVQRANPKKKNKGGEAARAVLSVLGILKNG